MLDALPLSENLYTRELVVNNVNEVKQPIMYEYISDDDFDNTQGVVSLDINNARVLSSYTRTQNITSNGQYEWDAVDSFINMPILNYKYNVQLPIWETPNDYTAKRITTDQYTGTSFLT